MPDFTSLSWVHAFPVQNSGAGIEIFNPYGIACDLRAEKYEPVLPSPPSALKSSVSLEDTLHVSRRGMSTGIEPSDEEQLELSS
jgi:hypothetical protein